MRHKTFHVNWDRDIRRQVTLLYVTKANPLGGGKTSFYRLQPTEVEPFSISSSDGDELHMLGEIPSEEFGDGYDDLYQSLMDALWAAKYRPSSEKVALPAQEKHLTDMRKLVFHLLEVKND